MKILFITIAWPSKGQRNLYTDLMEEFVLQGHEVNVVGTIDKPVKGGSELSTENGITVLRTQVGKIRKSSYVRKGLSLVTLGNRLMKAIKKHYGHQQFDLIIGPTPPITLSRLHRRLKRKYRAPFYLLLKDIWPQGSVDLGVIRKGGLIWCFLRNHELRLYKTVDYIGCMSARGRKYLLEHNNFLDPDRVEVCPNSIRPTREVPDHRNIDIRRKYGIPEDACVFIFSGNLGVGHGLHFLVNAIRELSDYPGAFFVIGGAGTQFSYLKREFEAFSPKNAFLYSWLSREDFEKILNTSDVGLVLLYKYTSPQFPSRLLSYLDYGKPALCAINKETDMGEIVEDAGCGIGVLHGDLKKFINSVKYLSENEERRREMGMNGRRLLTEQYTVKRSYRIIINRFQ